DDPTSKNPATPPPADPAVRRADARPTRRFGSMLTAPIRHVESSISLRHAYAAVRGNDFDRALADCDQILAIEPDRAEAYCLRGTMWAARSQPARALPELDEAIRLDPKMAAAYVNRGLIWVNQGDLDRGIADLDRAIQLAPSDAMAFNNRGWGR